VSQGSLIWFAIMLNTDSPLTCCKRSLEAQLRRTAKDGPQKFSFLTNKRSSFCSMYFSTSGFNKVLIAPERILASEE